MCWARELLLLGGNEVNALRATFRELLEFDNDLVQLKS
jgi:hypothetical protein